MRYIVCINHQKAEKDAAERAAILAALERQLKRGDKALVGNTGYRRFLRTVGDGHFVIDPGFVVYTHVSGHYGPFYTRVIAATVSEAPYVLDGLMHHVHQTDLRIREHYTDTAGATDHVFGLCCLLGFLFAPRIKDLKERKLYTIEKPGTYPLLEPLIGEAIDPAAVIDQWPVLMAAGIRVNLATFLFRLRPYRHQRKRVWLGGQPLSIGIGGHLAMPPLPHHRAYGSVPRRFGGLGPASALHGGQSETAEASLREAEM